jgi:N-methylhydantoinase B
MKPTDQAVLAQGRTCDPITLEVVRGVISSTMQEMETLIERTAMSPFIREKKDFHVGLYDSYSRLIYTKFYGGSDSLVQTVTDIFPMEAMREGDLYWYNDCYASRGTVSHSPDQVLLRPVFYEGRIVAFVEAWAHFNDIGGMRPGSISADCTDIYQEGIIVPPVKLIDQGKVNEDILRLFCRNSRYPDMVKGDMRALIAATNLGKRRLEEACARFGSDRVESAFEQLIERTKAKVQARMKTLFPEGTYQARETVDSDGQGNGPFQLRYTLNVGPNGAVLDATESDDQTRGPINLLLNPGNAASMLGNYILGQDRDFISNHGLKYALDEVKLRPGSILQPLFPAALGTRGVTAMRHLNGMLGLVALASNGHSNASFSAYVIYFLRGLNKDGKPFLLSDGIGVGSGARPYADGNDAIYAVANENYPCEFVEITFPVRVRRYLINRDTAGAGFHRGGCGLIREVEVLAESAVLSMRIDSIKSPPWGVNGGKSGKPGGCWINPGTDKERYVEGVSDGTIVYKGDIIRVMTAGGGGWGHPYDREAQRVLEDVLDGFVSVEAAEAEYGVVLTDSGEEIDEQATAALRSKRPATKLFHQIEYKETLA